MGTFHSFIKKSCIFFLIVTIASITVGASYMVRHDITVNSFIGDYEYLTHNYNNSFMGNNIAAIFTSDRSSDYPTRTITKTAQFPLTDEIFITADFEKITFIEEERNDLLVDYYREYPETDKYQVNFDTQLDDSSLYITSFSSTNNLAITQNYIGKLQIHVPKDSHFKKISIESDAAVLTDSNLYTNTDVLSLVANMGDIDINLEDSLDSLFVNCDLGTVSIKTQQEINQFEISTNFGSVNLDINADIDALTITENLGDTQLHSTHDINELSIINDVGNINADLNGKMDTIHMSTNLGDIDVTLPSSIDNIYASTDLGDVHSEFTQVESSSSSYAFSSNLGSIHITKQ